MTAESVIALLCASAIVLYLLYTLLRPEKF